MSIYTGNPSFKETTFRKRFNLKGVKGTGYTVLDGKSDALDFHKDHEAEYKAIQTMPDIENGLGYVMAFNAELSKEDKARLEEASCHSHQSADGEETTFLFDGSDVEILETKTEDITVGENLPDNMSGAE